jgi:hypothetical protein
MAPPITLPAVAEPTAVPMAADMPIDDAMAGAANGIAIAAATPMIVFTALLITISL